MRTGRMGALLAVLAAMATTAAACAGEGRDPGVRRQATQNGGDLAGPGRLLASFGAPRGEPGPTGLHPLGLARGRDGLIYVPPGYRPDHPAPLVLGLHGAGGTASHAIDLLRPFADREGLVLLAVDSRQSTWDVIVDDYGPDVEFIERALAHLGSRYAVDPARVAVSGFSDGASYALSIGLTNGDLFRWVLAFSPGFARPNEPRGRPHLFVSHGVHDRVLPIEVTSRRVVPRLRSLGYRITYREFDGPHSVPAEMAAEAISLFLDESGTPPAAAPESG